MTCDKITADINCNTIVQNEEFNPGFVYVYVLQLNKANGSTISQVFIREKAEEEIKFTIRQDGYYTLCKIIVPTDPNNQSTNYYYYEGDFYKNDKQVELAELININPEVSGLELAYYYYFQLCKLRRCYIAAAKSILDKRAPINCDSNMVSKADIYKRDLLLSAINVITYLAEMEQFEEAERLLERVTGCNGLCDSYEFKTCGCGCGG